MLHKFATKSKGRKKFISTERISNLSPTVSNQDILSSLRDLRSKYVKSIKNDRKNNISINTISLIHSHTNIEKTILQEQASDRLSKGRKHQDFALSDFEKTNSKISVKKLDENIKLLEDSDMTAFLSKIKVFKDLKNEIALNYQVAKTETCYNDINLTGLFFSLQDMLDLLSKNIETDFKTLSNNLLFLNNPIRELIRLFKAYRIDKGADLLDLF